MRWTGLFKRHSRPSAHLVCDVGGGSIAVGIIEIDMGRSPAVEVLQAERRSLPFSDKPRGNAQSADQLKTLLTETLGALLERRAKLGSPPPQDITCVVHAPWVRSATVRAERIFDAPTEITAPLIGSIAEEASREKTGLNSGDFFEKFVTRVHLNGYHTHLPEGKRASRAAVVVLESDMDQDMRRALDAAFGSVLPGRTYTYRSFPFVLSIVADDYAPTLSHYTLVDVGSASTAASAVGDGSQIAHAEADLGWRSAIEALSAKAGTSPEEALSRVRMVAEDTCTDALCSEVLGALKEAEPRFVESYGKMLAKLSTENRVPGTMLLVAPPDSGGWFVNLFSRIDFAQFTVAEQPFSVEQLFAHYLAKGVSFGAGAMPDAGLATSAAFVHIGLRDAGR